MDGLTWFGIFGLVVGGGAIVYVPIKSKRDIRATLQATAEQEWQHRHLDPVRSAYRHLYRIHQAESWGIFNANFVLENEQRTVLSRLEQKAFNAEPVMNGAPLAIHRFRPDDTLPETGEKSGFYRIRFLTGTAAELASAVIISQDDEKGYEITWQGERYRLMWKKYTPDIPGFSGKWPARLIQNGRSVALITRADEESYAPDFSNRLLFAAHDEMLADLLMLVGILCLKDFFPRHK